ncbi:hypothetical protein DH2020_020413 [Rehmannia glutinosa]|uniref:HMA domain-containing protein n=1 Tax=Rehmannia glutinosa TaxID=99300 RepID=A0ABR0WHJ2_REHGL
MNHQTVELKVRMCCTGCERVVKEAIHKLRGVDSVEVDLEMEKVTVIGYADRNKVLKAVRRAGKRAEFWPHRTRHSISRRQTTTSRTRRVSTKRVITIGATATTLPTAMDLFRSPTVAMTKLATSSMMTTLMLAALCNTS